MSMRTSFFVPIQIRYWCLSATGMRKIARLFIILLIQFSITNLHNFLCLARETIGYFIFLLPKKLLI